MVTRKLRWALVLGIGLAVAPAGRAARGQAPILPGEGVLTPSGASPGSNTSILGPLPGSGGANFYDQAVGGGQIIGGRPGASTPRVPTSISVPGGGPQATPSSGVVALPPVAPLTEVPLYGTFDLPLVDDAGPPGGLTFDGALDLLLKANLDLLARRFEIPSARADQLTASLRANPIFYADGQLVPYGEYTRQRPGGQTQYDVNISHPWDYSGKRRARMAVAASATRIVEALYQDAVRLQIANLANAYISVLAARETARYVDAGVKGLEGVLAVAKIQKGFSDRTSADVSRLHAQSEFAAVGRDDADASLRRAKRALGVLLGMSPPEAEQIEILAPVREDVAAIPPIESLIATALSCRPDVVAARLGKTYAAKGLQLQRANRFADAYVLYQPFTFQNNSPNGLKSSYSYALGVTFPLPVYNRNQGNIERARINIQQTDVQLAALERLVINEVRQAEQEYAVTRGILDRVERLAVTASKKALEDTRQLFTAGDLKDVSLLLNVQREFNDNVRLYRDTAVRHRRSMAALNAAVGSRLLP